MQTRHYNPLDRLVMNVDQTVRTLFGKPQTTERPNPAGVAREAELSDKERDHVARLMRINHTGEVCAQALYQGQALTAGDPATRESMERSAVEESDHLDWCESRVRELGGRLSILNPLWYAGSFLLGAAAGIAGDKWSLGFIAETEKQVEGHLDEHLNEIPEHDARTRAILEQMKVDEGQHGETARAHGGVDLPAPLKLAMRVTSKVMTKSVYHL